MWTSEKLARRLRCDPVNSWENQLRLCLVITSCSSSFTIKYLRDAKECSWWDDFDWFYSMQSHLNALGVLGPIWNQISVKSHHYLGLISVVDKLGLHKKGTVMQTMWLVTLTSPHAHTQYVQEQLVVHTHELPLTQSWHSFKSCRPFNWYCIIWCTSHFI